MAKHAITASMNIGHLRTLAEFCSKFIDSGCPLSDTQRAALEALGHATAGAVYGNPIATAFDTLDRDAMVTNRDNVVGAARAQWVQGNNDELSIGPEPMVWPSYDDEGETPTGYWVEAYVYVSAEANDAT